MSETDTSKTLIFRCPAGLEGVLPPPIPASHGTPDWLKAMPPQAFNAINARDENTVKRCPPFIDAMTSGYLLPLMCDLRIENGEFTWDSDLPAVKDSSFPRSPIGFHDASQVVGSPLFEPDRFLIKFHNIWTIESPEGYSVLFTHPFNRFELPFTTLTGLVDCDLYTENRVHFPAHWHNSGFSGVLAKGTPIAQCIPIKREIWSAQTLPYDGAAARRVEDVSRSISSETSVYRRQYRA